MARTQDSMPGSSKIKVCVAGATGWTGGMIARHILQSHDLQLTAAIARTEAGRDIGEFHGLAPAGVTIVSTLGEALAQPIDVLIDYTKPDSVKQRTMDALRQGLQLVIGTSGLSAMDYEEIEKEARYRLLGVIAAGNFSITAALASHFALIAAKYLPSWEIVDYARHDKPDAPSGTTRELAQKLSQVRKNELSYPIEQTIGPKEARGANIGGTQIHSVRLPNYTLSFETIFGLPNESLTIRHDSGTDAEPYVAGTLLAVRKVRGVIGLIRGLDHLLFH